MATTASIEKVVRKILDEEFDQRNEATLEAIEQISRVLTEEVIPRLGDDADDGIDDEDAPTSDNGGSRAMRAGAPRPGDDDEDADDPEADDGSTGQAVPMTVSEACDTLYASLDAEQAEALAALFAAIAQERADESEQPEQPEQPEEPEEPEETPAQKPPKQRARPRARPAA